MTDIFLQKYGWVVVSLLGGLLVALMFVMGANLHLGNFRLDTLRKRAVLKATSRRWAYALAALVVFAGVIYFTFPLFFRAFFVGARRLWELVLVTFFLQLVAYIICNKNEKLLGSTFFCILLMINGFLAPLRPHRVDPAHGPVHPVGHPAHAAPRFRRECRRRRDDGKVD